MTVSTKPTISVAVDPANPGQFFACCGLLELADRFWGGAEGWFDAAGDAFSIRPLDGSTTAETTLGVLLNAAAAAPVRQLDSDDDCSSPLEIPAPFGLRLDWWQDIRSGGKQLKVWAGGTMHNARIARAMQHELRRNDIQSGALFEQGHVVYDPSDPDKKVEPFYFDARRGSNAHPIDIGFSTDSVQMQSKAYPAVEFLCLVGLQRFRPTQAAAPRTFDYHTWTQPLTVILASLAACDAVSDFGGCGFRFENAFRTAQRKHKGFTQAKRVTRDSR